MFITHNIIFDIICKSIAWFDRHIIDGTMNGLAAMTQFASARIKGMQNGLIQSYVLWYFLGALAIAAVTWICIL